MEEIKSVDEYIANAPKEAQDKLKQLKKIIVSLVPEAVERMSYGMPYYGYKGRLAYIGYAKKHVGLYIPPPVIEEHQRELENYETAKATVRFPLDEELPIDVIKKLVKARVTKNEEMKQR